MKRDDVIERVLGNVAIHVAKETNANNIISVERVDIDSMDESMFYNVKVTVFNRTEKGYVKSEYRTKIKKPEAGSIVSMKELLMDAIAHKYIKKGERVVCIQDSSLGSGFKGLMLVFDVDRLFFDISTHKLAENIKPEVIEAVMDIALEIGREGREGRKVGTAFILGDRSVERYSKQMIINPFANISPEDRKITDPNLKESVKNFAQLDGVFFIDGDGVINSAGSYININSEDLFLPEGYGTRHMNCAAITAKSDAIAIVVSESGGRVRVFKKGKVVISF